PPADRTGKLGHVLIRLECPLGEQRLPGQRETVAVDAAASDTDDDVPGRDLFTENDPIQGHDTGTYPHEVHALARRAPLDDVRDLRDFTTNDGDAGQFRTSIEAFGDLLQHARRGTFD